MPEVGEAGLWVKIFSGIPGKEVRKGGTVEAVPFEGAFGPIPGGVLALAEVEDLGGGL